MYPCGNPFYYIPHSPILHLLIYKSRNSPILHVNYHYQATAHILSTTATLHGAVQEDLTSIEIALRGFPLLLIDLPKQLVLKFKLLQFMLPLNLILLLLMHTCIYNMLPFVKLSNTIPFYMHMLNHMLCFHVVYRMPKLIRLSLNRYKAHSYQVFTALAPNAHDQLAAIHPHPTAVILAQVDVHLEV